MEKKIHSLSVMERCVVTPASAPDNDVHAPLTFLDMQWMYFTNIQRLVFYKIPNLSQSHFLGHIFPNLKQSLSLTLDHFPLVAGKLIIPPNSNSAMPEICYRNDDGVMLICAECDDIDFDHLVSNDERDCAEFYPLVPDLKESSLNQLDSESSEVSTTTPVLALQITLFPGVGLSVGISNHHALGDAGSMFRLMNTWSINNFKLSHSKDGESQLPDIPAFEKNLIQDDKGLAKIIWDQWMDFVSNSRGNPFFESTRKTSKVRKTFVISAEDVKKLKNLVSADAVHVSSFVVVCSYMWTCLAKLRMDQQHEGEQTEHIIFAADCRDRTDPPIPANYFGNCQATCLTGLNGSDLTAEGGFQRASELLGRTIKEKFRQRDAVFDGAEDLMEIFSKLNWSRCLSLAGSTRQNYYNLDFGWGFAVKFEFISIDGNGAVSLTGCRRDSDGGVEVGLALTMPQMYAFSSIFMEGLHL